MRMQEGDQPAPRTPSAMRAYLGGANVAAIPFLGIALLLTLATAWRVFATCNDDSDYLGIGPYFFAFAAAAFAGMVFTIAGLIALVQKRWKRLAGAVVGGVLSVVLGFGVPYLSYELSNCPPASPGGPVFAQSRPFQKCLARHGGFEVDFVSPDIAVYEDLVRGMVVARPPRSVLEELRPRYVASVMLFRDEKAARDYSDSIGAGTDTPAPHQVRDAWFLVRHGGNALTSREQETGESTFRWIRPTNEERKAVEQCVAAIPTWSLNPPSAEDGQVRSRARHVAG